MEPQTPQIEANKNVRFIIHANESKIEGNTDIQGQIDLTIEKNLIGSCGFVIDELEIYVDLIEIKEKYLKQGYGRMLIDILKGLSRIINKPIVLYVTGHKSFYINNGFVSILDYCLTNNLILSKGIWKHNDLIWIPEALLNRKVKIEIH
jgi:hypothetical protein